MNSEHARSTSTDRQEPSWRELATLVDRFADAWEHAPPQPELDEHLPPRESALYRLALVELIKIDLICRARDLDADPFSELLSHLQRWPLLDSEEGPPRDLILESIQILRRQGAEIDVDRWVRRFPHAADTIRQVLDQAPFAATTSLFARRLSGSHEFKSGMRVDDFDLLTEIGRGAFATVFLARQVSMQRLVALKISADQGNEPQTLAQLDHPHIVRVYDQRALPERSIRLLYMQYVAGGTLAEAMQQMRMLDRADRNGKTWLNALDESLKRRGESAPAESPHRQIVADMTWAQVVCQLGREIADALQYAHERGVLHRDLKPANVLLSPHGHAKLVDFNVSFCAGLEAASPLAYFGGSLPYMSPEQLDACRPNATQGPESLDQRSDVFSLGVLLFELWSGARPFADPPLETRWTATLAALAEQRRLGITRARLDSAFSGEPRCPRLLQSTLLACLADKTDNRLNTAGDVARSLKLAGNPDTESLLFGDEEKSFGWSRWVVPLAIVLGAIPNLLAAWFAINYNAIESVPFADRDFFLNTQGVINAIAFPLGFAAFVLLALPTSLVISGRRTDPPMLLRALNTNPLIGAGVALVGVFEWTFFGVIYPIVLTLSGIALRPTAWQDFIGSHILAGLFAAVYSYFVITFFALRFWHGQIVRKAMFIDTPGDDLRGIRRVGRWLPVFQFLAAAVPLIGAALLVFLKTDTNEFALKTSILVSLAGIAAVYWLSRQIQAMVGVYQEL